MTGTSRGRNGRPETPGTSGIASEWSTARSPLKLATGYCEVNHGPVSGDTLRGPPGKTECRLVGGDPIDQRADRLDPRSATSRPGRRAARRVRRTCRMRPAPSSAGLHAVTAYHRVALGLTTCMQRAPRFGRTGLSVGRLAFDDLLIEHSLGRHHDDRLGVVAVAVGGLQDRRDALELAVHAHELLQD